MEARSSSLVATLEDDGLFVTDEIEEPQANIFIRFLRHDRTIQVFALCVLLGAWELCARAGVVPASFTSEPSRFFPALWDQLIHGNLVSLMGVTLTETMIGFALASVLGLLAGIVLAESRVAEKVSRPFLVGFNNLPRIALAPLFVLWFGLGSSSRVALIVSLGFFIVTFNTYAGLQAAGRDYMLLAKTLGVGRIRRFRRFVFPSAVPTIFSGLQLCLSYAFLGAVVGEMLTGNQGLGGYFTLQLSSFDVDNFFAGMVLLVIVSLALSSIMRVIELQLIKWRQIEMRGLEAGASGRGQRGSNRSFGLRPRDRSEEF